MDHSAPPIALVICTSFKLDNDVVNEVPMFGPWMHPRSLVHLTELEEGVCDDKIQFRAER